VSVPKPIKRSLKKKPKKIVFKDKKKREIKINIGES
jgi:hypothetical protein